jgi:DNA (cytosine-5)-methyltransferase 1
MEEGRLHKAAIWSDVTTFDGRPFVGKVDYISAGFPCQPWSVAGKQKGTEDERWLWDDIKRIICEVRPRFLFLENVPGVVMGGLDPILRDLAEIGFNAEWGLLKASEVGARHHRNRFFLFGYCANTDNRLRPKPFKEIPTGGDIISSSRSEFPNSNISGVKKFALSDFQREEIPNIIGTRSDVPNSNGSRSPESREICEGTNGSKFECDGEKGTVIQHPNDKGWTELDSSSIPSELGFINGRYDTVGRGPSWWCVEPGVGRVVDGMAHRVDRLRACGNGVVPLQAAVAYSILIERAIEGGGLNLN